MSTSRRRFLSLGALAAGAPAWSRTPVRPDAGLGDRLDQVARTPVLRRDLVTTPVVIASIELLKGPSDFLVRVRSRDGAEGVAVGHPAVLQTTWPILTTRVAPAFLGSDARELESSLQRVYLERSNYKWQGLAFWVPVASVELAILDLLGQVARRPIGELLGGVVRREVAVYRASGNRGNTAEAEIAHLERLVADSGARAIKFRLGARMRRDEASDRRDRALIVQTRKTFGDAMTIYADANGSFDVPAADGPPDAGPWPGVSRGARAV